MMIDIGQELEALNRALVEAEDRFVNAQTGTRAEIVLGEDARLIYSKEGGEWGLSVATKAGGTCDLLSANMKHRIAAAHALPEMEQALLLACDERVKEIRVAIVSIEKWLTTSTLVDRAAAG